MKGQLTGLDSAFLAVETDAAHMHMTAVFTVEPRDGVPATFDEICSHLGPRLCNLPIFRRTLQEVALGVDHPVWIEQQPDLEAHVDCISLSPPGTWVDLEELVARLAARPLDRAKPLWEMRVVEGLEGGRTAVVAKVHHALIDGVAGAEIFGRLFDPAPDTSALAGVNPNEPPSPTPSRIRRLLGAGKSVATRPFDIGRESLGSALTAAKRLWAVARTGDRESVLPASFAAPNSPLSGAITPRRETRFGSLPLDELMRLKRDLGVKLNDVVLALCAGALRRYLQDRGDLPRSPLVVAVPVSVAADDSNHTTGNRVSAVTVELPVHLADPIDRMVKIHRGLEHAKRAHRAIDRNLLSGWAEVVPPILLSGLTNLYSWLDLADRHRPVVNLIVSNVRGPEFSLYCAGHRVEACHPLGPIYEGCAINLTVMSYDGRLHFGWTGCPDVVPEVAKIGSSLAAAQAELRDAAEQRQRERRRRFRLARHPTASRRRSTGPADARASRTAVSDRHSRP